VSRNFKVMIMQKHTVQMGTGWQSPAIQRHVKSQAQSQVATRAASQLKQDTAKPSQQVSVQKAA
jgi:hypothetical protein